MELDWRYWGPENAIEAYQQALALDPCDVEVAWSLSLSYLAKGDFSTGFRLYEVRDEARPEGTGNRTFVEPKWLGQEDLSGKVVLLHAEQGFCDTLQFCRDVKLVETGGVHVVLEVPRPLARRMRSLGNDCEIVIQGESLPRFDYHVPLLSLPHALDTSVIDIPFEKKALSLCKR